MYHVRMYVCMYVYVRLSYADLTWLERYDFFLSLYVITWLQDLILTEKKLLDSTYALHELFVQYARANAVTSDLAGEIKFLTSYIEKQTDT